MRRRLDIPVFLFLALWPVTTLGAGDDWKKPYVELQVDGVGGGVDGGWRAGFDVVFAGGGEGFHVAVAAPIRFDDGGLRDQEWDEVNDFGRILGLLQYRDKTGDIDVAVRNVNGVTLGAGNLVSMYNGTVDTDHWRTGVAARLHWPVAGGDLFLDAVTGPAVFGARAYFRPLWFADKNGQVGRLEIGAQFTTDISAPSTLGSGTADSPSDVLPDRYGMVSNRPEVLTGWSVDVRWPVRVAKPLEVTPWMAWSRIGWADAAHVGVDLAFRVSDKVRISATGEYAFMQSGFASGYFDNVYMADRHDFSVWREAIQGAVSKKAFLESPGADRSGGAAGVAVAWDPWLSAWLRFDIDENGVFSRLRSGVTVTVPDRLLFTASIYARGFGRDNRDASVDRLYGSVVADVTVWKFIGVFASYTRDLHVPVEGPDIGRYVGGHAGLAGVRFTFGLLETGKKSQAPQGAAK